MKRSMRQLDKLLISSFIPPFVVTFMIAIFVLLMQILWLYIDDIAGKGLGMFLLLELIGYKCVGLIPMALPLAILISSVMVLGSLAEHYELSSFKSAGVSLFRVMRPLIVFGFLAMGFSYVCSNNLIPIANLKFGSRMYDIQRQKPALRLDAGVFNDDFDQYAIHIGEKERDGKSIRDVLIYDHRGADRGQLSETVAESGQMYATPDGQFFVMNLVNGHQYIETAPSASNGQNQFPFIRVSFESWNKVFDLSQFQISRTNEELFKQNRSMLSSGQLREAIDSLSYKILERQKNLANQVATQFTFMTKDSTFLKAEPTENAPEGESRDTARLISVPRDSTAAQPVAEKQKTPGFGIARGNGAATAFRRLRIAQKEWVLDSTSKAGKLMISLDTIGDFDAVLKSLQPYERRGVLDKAQNQARAIRNQAESAARTLDNLKENKVKFIYELHTKYSMAVVCIIFVFIGAPMGAIIRKGGFGFPILVSIVFFMLFVVLTIFCRKIAETFAVPAAVAAWIPGGILFPIGMYVTYKAMRDAKALNFERLKIVFSYIGALFSRLIPSR